MWIASKLGFFSIVQKGDGFHIRARSRLDLENLRGAAALAEDVVESYPGSDYPWRILVPEASLGRVFATLHASIDYGNFKGVIGGLPDQRDKLSAYHNIWSEMRRWQDEARR